jgi:CheY-like chemotaxis protein
MKPYISVLVIEDSLDDFFFLQEILKSSDELSAEVHHANRLAAGLSIVEKERVDVAILDLSLPDSFGLDTFMAFHQRYPLIPTIILSGQKDRDLAFEAVQKGAQDYLFKGDPSPSAIIRTVRYAIERQGLMSELKRALDHVHQLQGMLPICMMWQKGAGRQGLLEPDRILYFQVFASGVQPRSLPGMRQGLLSGGVQGQGAALKRHGFATGAGSDCEARTSRTRASSALGS